MPKLEPGEEVDGTPYDFDRWVLKIAAAFTAQMPASSGEARLYWQLVMDIGPGARYWMEDFFHGWFMTGSKFATSQICLRSIGERLITYALDAPNWAGAQGRSYLTESWCRELMSLGITVDLIGKEEFLPVVKSLLPQFQRWAEPFLEWPDSAKAFSYFLGKPAGRALLPNAIVWLNVAVQEYSEHDWRERDLDQALAGALLACWRHNSSEVSNISDLRAHFIQLLNVLCNRLGEDSLALRTQISQFISADSFQ